MTQQHTTISFAEHAAKLRTLYAAMTAKIGTTLVVTDGRYVITPTSRTIERESPAQYVGTATFPNPTFTFEEGGFDVLDTLKDKHHFASAMYGNYVDNVRAIVGEQLAAKKRWYLCDAEDAPRALTWDERMARHKRVYSQWHDLLEAHYAALSKRDSVFSDAYGFAECHESPCLEATLPRLKKLLEAHRYSAIEDMLFNVGKTCGC